MRKINTITINGRVCKFSDPDAVSYNTQDPTEEQKEVARKNLDVPQDDAPVGAAVWSSKNIVDKLCPSFEKKGTLVQCEPVEGYPLEVAATDVGEFIVTVCGKNLYNPNPREEGGYPLTDGWYINFGNGATTGSGTHATYCATLCYIPVSHLRGRHITLNHTPNGINPGMAFYDANEVFLGASVSGKGTNILVPDDAVYMRFTTYIENKAETQIEIGSAATDYEPYCGNTAAGADGKTVVPAVRGENTIFAYSGDSAVEITVIGKADPVTTINSLVSRVEALEKAAVDKT